MCGIFGISYGPDGPSGEDWSPSELMAIMFPAIVHRGPHAYGWMYYDGESVYYQKHTGRADTKHAQQMFWIDPEHEARIQWMVCHVRYATHGSPEKECNNHPLLHHNIIGVHNGVIRNYASILAETGRMDDETEVDSESIFAAINRWGHREGLRRIDGDMVAVYANLEKPATLHVARSHGRPLVLANTPAGSKIFASEAGVIQATGIETSPASPLSPYRLIRIRGGRITERISYVPNTRRYVDPVVPRRPVVNHTPTGSWFHDSMQARANKRGEIFAQRKKEGLSDNPAIRNAQMSSHMDERRERARRLQEAARDPRSKHLRNHEKFDEFYYLDGVLLTEEQYLSIMADRVEMETESCADVPADPEPTVGEIFNNHQKKEA